MIKLLYITNSIKGAAGLERVLSIKASYLAEKLNYEVHILVLNDTNLPNFYDFSPKIKIHSIAVFGNPVSYAAKYISGIKATIKNVKPNIISVCDDGLKAFFIPKFITTIPIIYERHVSKIIELGVNPTFTTKCKTKFKFTLMNYLANSFDKFVVLTQDNLNEWNLKNTIVISNPLSFYPEGSSTLQNKKVIAVGKQGIQKGYDRLLNSWKIISEKHPTWQLSIYGAFENDKKLLHQAQNLKIEDSVQFLEPVKNIEDKLIRNIEI